MYAQVLKQVILPLVDNPASIEVKEMSTASEDMIELLVIAKQEDLSRLIGKSGRMANAIRQVMLVLARQNKHKISINFESY